MLFEIKKLAIMILGHLRNKKGGDAYGAFPVGRASRFSGCRACCVSAPVL